MILFLLVVTATFRPPAPTVGDLITIQFEKPVALDPSPAYEVVSHKGAVVTVRTFEPKPFALSGKVGDVRFRNLVVPMKSVLKPQDSMEPAPLRPPLSIESTKTARNAIAIAAAAAVLLWAAVVMLARRLRPAAPVPAIPPVEKFRAAVQALRASRGAGRWAGLADATREYLAAKDSMLGEELTTSELLRALSSVERARDLQVIAEILHQGDLEKFSPWGAPGGDFDALAERALTIPEFFEPPPIELEEKAA